MGVSPAENDAVPQVVAYAVTESPNGDRSFALWLEPSWRAAQRLGIGEEEFSAWARLGLWNLEGDQAVARLVVEYRDLAGHEGYLFAEAGVSAAAAREQVEEHGLENALEAVRVMQALGAMPSVEAQEREEAKRAVPAPVADPVVDLSDLIGASRKNRA